MAAEVLESLGGGLVVSCQAYPGEPMRDPAVMKAVAAAAVEGGAVGIRAQGIADLEAINAAVEVPVIGLLKVPGNPVFITPTVADCTRVAATGSEIVALDGTPRPRPDGGTLADCIATAHAAGALVMADCGCLEDAVASIAAGADCVGTTLAGYTGSRPRTDGPDFELLGQLIALGDVPVIAEGRMRTPQDVSRAFGLGAHAVVVGTAITHPTSITRGFARATPRGVSAPTVPVPETPVADI